MTSPLVLSASDVVLASSVIALVVGAGAMVLRAVKRPERIPVRVRTDDDEQR